MQWTSIVSLVHAMINGLGLPRALVLHCGGNDIGLFSIRELIKHMKFALYVVCNMLPGCSIIFSCILPRKTWRYSNNAKAMEHARKRVNRSLIRYLMNNGCYVIRHLDLDDGHKALYDVDGTHLSFLGNDIFINAIQGGLEQFLMYPYNRLYPM